MIGNLKNVKTFSVILCCASDTGKLFLTGTVRNTLGSGESNGFSKLYNSVGLKSATHNM
jgi:hypothetical protein